MSYESDWREKFFQEYCLAMERNQDQCYICNRTSDEVYEHSKKRIQQFPRLTEDEKRTYVRDLDHLLPLSYFLTYRAKHPVCLDCYSSLVNEHNMTPDIEELISEIKRKKGDLWPEPDREP